MEKKSKNEPPSEGARLADDVLTGVIKAKKLLKMYPSNNPIYLSASDAVFDKYNNFFLFSESLTLKISQHDIYLEDEQIYHNSEKDDNLALFFFKDGIREITFSNGLSKTELEEFLGIMAIDFDRDAPDDDIVTAIWEKDFENIKIIADDLLLTDEEMTEEKRAYEQIKEKTFTDDSLKQAYQDSIDAETKEEYSMSPLTEEELLLISKDLAAQKDSKQHKFVIILFELLYLAPSPEVFREVVGHFKSMLEHCVKRGDFTNASYILDKIRKDIDGQVFDSANAGSLETAYSSINNSAIINHIGGLLENAAIINEAAFTSFCRHLGKKSIQPFMLLLGDMKSLKGRHLIIAALSVIGSQDIKALASGLQDTRWDVVRDTIFILGKIGSPSAFEYLKNIISHSDERIRREVVRTIGNINSPDTHLYLSKALNDRDSSIRIIAVRGLGNLKSGQVKKVLLNALSRKDFASKEYSEKKEFYSVMANWNDKETRNFLTSTLKSWKLWKRNRHNETRACAAFALGLLKEKEALPLLTKTSTSNSKVLRDASLAAISKIKA